MRKRFLWFVAGLVALGMVTAACGQDQPAVDGDGAPAFTTIEDGILTVGSDIPYPPFEDREGGKNVGFDIDLITEIANRIGLDEISVVDTDFETIFTQLATGRFDVVIAASTITPEREEEVNFSDPYMRARQSLVVNSLERPDIAGVADLGQGDTVGVQSGTTGERYTRENVEPNGVEVRSFPEIGDAYTGLEANQLEGVINDEVSAIFEIEERPNLELVEGIETNEFYGIAVDPNNEPLLEAINDALTDIIADGTYDQLYDKWITDVFGPGSSITAEPE